MMMDKLTRQLKGLLHSTLRHSLRVIGVLSLAQFLLSSPATAQAPKKEMPVPSTPTLKVSTDVVTVNCVVRDKHGALIPTLRREDFELTEDNIPQQVSYFGRETDKPLSLGILVDASVSQFQVLAIEREHAAAFVREVLLPKDLALVLRFDSEVELLQDLTNDLPRLESAINEIKSVASTTNSSPQPCHDRTRGGFPVPGDSKLLPEPQLKALPFQTTTFPNTIVGETRLFDSIHLAVAKLRGEIGRRAILVVGDGVDTGSRVSLENAIEVAHNADVVIYGIAVVDRGFHTDFCRARRECYRGKWVLRKLTEETGGRVIDVEKVRDTARAFQLIAEELRTQYSIGYTPTNKRHDGSYRSIRVRVSGKDYRVQARRGYYAPVH